MKTEKITFIVEKKPKTEETIIKDRSFFSCGCFGGATVIKD